MIPEHNASSNSTVLNRKITSEERAWLIHGLSSLRTGEYVGCHAVDIATGTKPSPGAPIDPQPYLDQLDTLVVTKKCNCGQKNCHTVSFRRQGNSQSVALVEHQTDDGRLLIICVDEATRELSELEIV